MGPSVARLEQRAEALNLFLKDIYGAREILRAGIIPPELDFLRIPITVLR